MRLQRKLRLWWATAPLWVHVGTELAATLYRPLILLGLGYALPLGLSAWTFLPAGSSWTALPKPWDSLIVWAIGFFGLSYAALLNAELARRERTFQQHNIELERLNQAFQIGYIAIYHLAHVGHGPTKELNKNISDILSGRELIELSTDTVIGNLQFFINDSDIEKLAGTSATSHSLASVSADAAYSLRRCLALAHEDLTEEQQRSEITLCLMYLVIYVRVLQSSMNYFWLKMGNNPPFPSVMTELRQSLSSSERA